MIRYHRRDDEAPCRRDATDPALASRDANVNRAYLYRMLRRHGLR